MTAREYGIKCIKDEADALLELIPKMTQEFDRAVELMYRCHGKIIVTGVGKSGHVGAKIAATLSSTGTPAALHPNGASDADTHHRHEWQS